jgi:NAD(P)-dependent dehydrogenase (short-subunit alcohol dehydrogenase family)
MTEQKVALIIGGGSGIGADAARALHERGYAIGVMSSSGKGESLGNELGGLGYTGSNLDPDDLKRFVDTAVDRFGRIDAVVNSTGHGAKGGVLELSDEEWHTGMDIYLTSVIRVARLVTPVMKKAGGGSIVNVSSFAAIEPDPDFPTSAVFRAGLSAFTKMFSNEFAGDSIRMNNVLPGFVDSLPETGARRERIAIGRYSRVREISEAIVFLASEASSSMTGQNIRVDGGLTQSV